MKEFHDVFRSMFLTVGIMSVVAFMIGVSMVKLDEHYRLQDLKTQEDVSWK